MIDNVVIIGLNYEYNIEIAQSIADSFGLYFLNCDEYINYQLQNRKDMEELCGVEYLRTQENKAVKSCSEFENSIITIPSHYFLRDNQYTNFSHSLIIYIKFSKEKLIKQSKLGFVDEFIVPNLLTFEQNNFELERISKFIISVRNKKKSTIEDEIKKCLEEYCEHK